MAATRDRRAQAQSQIRLPGYPRAWRGERTLAEIKAEALRRAKLNLYPVTGISPADLQEAFASIHALGRDQWGPAFIAVGDRYMAEANRLAKSNPAEADKDYLKAWEIYSFGRWPVSWSAGRRRAYEKSLAAFRYYARSLHPPVQIVRIPYAGSEIVADLRLPSDRRGPVPLVIGISGLDGRKEGQALMFAPLLSHGIAILAVDGPGTGQAPVKFSPAADKMFSRILDYLQTQPEIDKSRIAVYGASLGAYWATKLAFTERDRLRFVLAQSPGADDLFQKKWVENNIVGNHEYLYGFAPALMHIMAGNVDTFSQFEAAWAANSLVAEHLIEKNSAPMLIIGGAKDSQVPIADTNLLLGSGQTPKYAWINPLGGHMAPDTIHWPRPRIFKEVTLPWLVRELRKNASSESR
ncbi:MAG TPA: alpha/beta hydrolase [Patescibacteria group bacterium]|nr:alpha/beta hydrolase [Patescibacteria group bacterium]